MSDPIPDELRPQPAEGRARSTAPIAPATARTRNAPPPKRTPPTTSPANHQQAAEPASGDMAPPPADPQPEPVPPPDNTANKPKRQRSKKPAPISTTVANAQCGTSVPQSLKEAMLADPRSFADLLRDAFTHHAGTVVERHPVQARTGTPGMRTTPRRRQADPNDPFVPIRISLYPDERDALDEWQAKTCLTRHAFVSELLNTELRT